ncbi:MAG TPA: HAD-IA family hydrolase [Acidimicrobiales bacterium]|nr:HAD-IA family hydrolase [Acidimicrobiales bacterium]
MTIRAVLWDVGGVIFSSPFDAFARYERENGLPVDFIRTLNATNPDTNAWAKLEQSAVGIPEFCDLFEKEARAAGHELVALDVLACLSGDIRPEMIEAIRQIRANGLKTAMLTNNFVGEERDETNAFAQLFHLFDVVIESSKVGVRKPDPRFYEMACKELDIEPADAVFLDDLGINLKPAKAMGITTIKVVTPNQALADLEAVVGFPLR